MADEPSINVVKTPKSNGESKWLMRFLTQFKWSSPRGKKYFRIFRFKNGKVECFFLHRIVNCTPKNLKTDHINGNILDMRACNLRSVTSAQNAQNRKHLTIST